MGSGASSHEVARCYCKGESEAPRPATYRCKYVGAIEWAPGDNGLHCQQLCFPPGAPKLAPFFVASGAGQSAFVACDACITAEVIGYFTCLPNGWTESNNIKAGRAIQTYEPMKDPSMGPKRLE